MRFFRTWGWRDRHDFTTGPNRSPDPFGGILFCTIIDQIAPVADTPPRIRPDDFRLANTACHQAPRKIYGDPVHSRGLWVVNRFWRTKLCDCAAGRCAGLCPAVYLDTTKLALV